MASRFQRAAALRDFAARLGQECERVQVRLGRLRGVLYETVLDSEDRGAIEHDFEITAEILVGVIHGAFDAQEARLYSLAEALEALEYSASSSGSSSSATVSRPPARGGQSQGGGTRVREVGPGCSGMRGPVLSDATPDSVGVPYGHVWSAERFDGLGSPIELRSFHRYQEGGTACAVVAQISILESLTGEHVTEEVAAHRARSMGIYDPNEGTPAKALGLLLAYYGVEVERHENAGIESIADALARGDRVLVPLNALEIWEPRRLPNGDVAPRVPPAGHAVWVTGLDEQDGQWTVLLNDSGHPEGAMCAVSLEDFSQAWGEFDNLVVFARERRR